MLRTLTAIALQEIWKVSEAGALDRGQSDTPNPVIFSGFSADTTVSLQPLPEATLKFMFLGDSFTYGSGTMVGRGPPSQYNCSTVPDYYPSASNYWSWGAILCRQLGANCHYIGRGGRGLYINADGTTYPRTLPHLFERTLATVQSKDWDHTLFQPRAVFITVGQNDYRESK